MVGRRPKGAQGRSRDLYGGSLYYIGGWPSIGRLPYIAAAAYSRALFVGALRHG